MPAGPGSMVILNKPESVPQATIVFDPAEAQAIPPAAVVAPDGQGSASVIYLREESTDANGTTQAPAATKFTITPAVKAPAPVPKSASPGPVDALEPVSSPALMATLGAPVAFPRANLSGPRKAYVDLSAAPCFAHSKDYQWIVGQVEYSNIAREWRLRYASVDEVDRFGGRVSLIENQHVSYLRDGMYIQVRGHLVNPNHTGNGPAHYRIEWFEAVKDPNVTLPPAQPK
jgi:hypothetical protein